MDDPIVIVAFAAALSILGSAAWLIAHMTDTRGKRLQRRLQRVGRTAHLPAGEALNIRLNESNSTIPMLDRIIKRYVPRPKALRTRFERTGRRISLGEYCLATLLVALIVGGALRAALGIAPILAVLAGLAAGFAVPHIAVNRMIARRLKAFTAQFPEAIDLIVRGLKSGLPVPVSMQSVAEEMGQPIGGVFRGITERLSLGLTLDEALGDAAERLPMTEFRFFVITLAIQRETGGNLGETLENLADILRKRRQMKQKIKAMSSEAKASAWILGSLPFLLFGILSAMQPAYIGTLFHDPRGMMMMGAGLFSLTIGILVMAKMVRFEI
jgi:tight adherence protein B